MKKANPAEPSPTRLSHADLLRLRRWNTPTIYNGWEQITDCDIVKDAINIEETHDFMPQMGPMVGYAVTLVVEPSQVSHKANKEAWADYRDYVARATGPKIVMVQDLDKPSVLGSFWGEVNANTHRALGCVGTITDGAIRDLDEMTNAGFKAIARRLCVGHAHVTPVRWNCSVDLFGRKIEPGQLVHADKHGFLVIPDQDQHRLLEAAAFMDGNECDTVISAARNSEGLSHDELLHAINEAGRQFGLNAQAYSKRGGEW